MRHLRALRTSLLLALVSAVFATAVAVANPPVVGSADTATADPTIPRPAGTPCLVPLFADLTFADFSPKLFDYTPPAACPGPWAKVVFTADFDVTAGRQFDRTGTIWLGGVNLYFGTTMEPSRTVARTWHVERDVTEYSALFAAAQPGRADLGNLVNETFTSIIHGSATLEFYPPAAGDTSASAADMVLPLSAEANGGVVNLDAPANVLARSFTLPRNIEAAYLDVVAQSQSGDEFWYTCVPDALTGPLQSCGSTAFRETEVSIDGQPAGVAPVYPWLYTGAIDPFLWRPIPSVQTLQFAPYRVDLTPFAGLLSDGVPHQIALHVFNAHGYFSTTASLLLYLDHGAAEVTGGVTMNTLAGDPTPIVFEDVTIGEGGTASGRVKVRSSRFFAIAGTVATSHGVVKTQVMQTLNFANRQSFDITATRFVQAINQSTTVNSLTLTQGGGRLDAKLVQRSWPLDLTITFIAAEDGSSTQTTTIRQELNENEFATGSGRWWPRWSAVSNVVTPTDTLLFNSAGALAGTRDQHTEQEFRAEDSSGTCFARTVRAVDGLVTEVADGAGCN